MLRTTSESARERTTVTIFFLGLPFLSVFCVYFTVSIGETLEALKHGFTALITTVRYENTAAKRIIHIFIYILPISASDIVRLLAIRGMHNAPTPIPIIRPSGIPIRHTILALLNTIFLSCFPVVPTVLRSPYSCISEIMLRSKIL